MGKGTPNTSQPAELAGLAPDDLATAQQAVPAPYFAGIRKLRILWIMKPVDQFTKPTPQNSGGKK